MALGLATSELSMATAVGSSTRPRRVLHARRCNGAGIGLPQRSCEAEARYVAKVLPSAGRFLSPTKKDSFVQLPTLDLAL